MKLVFLFLLTIILGLFEPLISVMFPMLAAFAPPIVFWLLLWLYWVKEDDRFFYGLAFTTGLVLDVVQQTYLGFHGLNLLISISVGVMVVRSIIDKSKLKYPGVIAVSWLIYFTGEYLYIFLGGM